MKHNLVLRRLHGGLSFVAGLILVFGLLLFTDSLSAQNLTIEIDKDTISIEETIMVKYLIDKSCKVSDLVFDDFLVVSGPNISKNTTIVNGKRTSESSYSIVLTPIKEGIFALPTSMCGASIERPINIVVKKGYESKKSIDEKIRSTRKVKKI